ncbi:GNAT family N-acetyltransferase [Rhizobium oryziradicis]|uniref:GNAT family N-acetyltransferase n=1 Tax=Rhizobium oryziradicis TaxID=1867956 RepID=A0A1Q8ZNY3_9HYPH|nr:N-acetyltransferase [Rhizobium oryziradicis]OLP43610.1 GNAT family N-acetyltransferase [Rhizobium oryziradicis]
MMVRPEKAGDEAAIAAITIAAFAGKSYSNQTEHLIVDRLRRAGALHISLVAMDSEEIIGHIAFSQVTLSNGDEGWFGLGPLSVAPSWQRQGFGRALVKAGLEKLTEQEAKGCCLLGSPDYYGAFGFVNTPDLVLPEVPPQYFQVLALSGAIPCATVAFHAGFYGE